MRTGTDSLRLTELLDARYYLLEEGMERSKRQSLLALAEVLHRHGVRYAVIGGLAVQFRRSNPRTTLDIDLAIRSYGEIPARDLERAGFFHKGRHGHSDNWQGPDGTPVQFTDDPDLHAAIDTAEASRIGPTELQVATTLELVRAKLRAAGDPSRRRSKRLQDLADACGLTEDHPEVMAELSPAERAQLESE